VAAEEKKPITDSLGRNLFSALHPEPPQFCQLQSQPRLQYLDSPENRPSTNYLFDREIFEDPVWHTGCTTSQAIGFLLIKVVGQKYTSYVRDGFFKPESSIRIKDGWHR
jgi:hypothetical protein